MTKPVLFTYFRSSASWRVRIALAYKGISYESKYVDLLNKNQLDRDFLEINPLGQVPVFIHNGEVITQSPAILDYIEHTFPEKPLTPKDPLKRTRMIEICELIGAGIQPYQNAIKADGNEESRKQFDSAKSRISKGFFALEKLLVKLSGEFSIGDELSLADCFLVPQVSHAINIYNMDIAKYPNISRIYDVLIKLESFQKADAYVQADCPMEQRIMMSQHC